jgi:serine/threonine-protein kinase
MVLRDGSVKVADFGIARVATSQNTMTQQALGSVHYISPEQAKGSRVDARSDIYSAGVVLYEMLTGKLPYEGDSPVAVAIQHINSVPTPPHEVNPSIPKGLEQITMKAMASNPNDRYPSSAAMLEDLDAFRRNPELVFNYSIPAVSGGKGRSSDGIDSTQYAHRTDGDHRASTPRTRPHRNSDNYGDDEEERSSRTPRKGSSKTKTKPRKSRTNPYVIGVAVVIVVFLAAVTAFALSNLRGIGGKGEEHTVPSLVGMIYDEAVLQYGDEFEIEIEDTQIDDTLTVGTILEQTPNGGDIRKGDKPTIKVVVSAHTDSTPMPNVVGKKQTDAIDELVAAGIPVGNIDVSQRVYSDEYDTGEVINSDPSAGMPITSSTKVSLTISKGKAPVIVPSFLGLSRTVVAAQLKELGLVGDFTMVDSDEEAGTILTQSIDANTEVEEGTVIRFTVSNGPKESESPSPSPDESPSASPSASTEPSTSPSPSASTSPSASPSQEPTTSSGVVVDKTITISLPQQDGDVFVKVEVNGTTVYGRNEDCAQGSIQVPLSGSGTQTVNVYFDGALHESYPVDFS